MVTCRGRGKGAELAPKSPFLWFRLFLSRFLEVEGVEGEGRGTRGVPRAVLWAYGNPRGLLGSLGSPWLILSRHSELECVVRRPSRPCMFTLKLCYSCACSRPPGADPTKRSKDRVPHFLSKSVSSPGCAIKSYGENGFRACSVHGSYWPLPPPTLKAPRKIRFSRIVFGAS